MTSSCLTSSSVIMRSSGCSSSGIDIAMVIDSSKAPNSRTDQKTRSTST
jgi:hypothetical protein